MLFETWGNQLRTLCLLPLMSGNTMLGVLKLAQCEEKVFTTANLKLLRQIAERVAIAVDNALAYQEIHRLKERLVDENLALTEQLNNVDSEFGEIIGRSEAMYSVLKRVEMVAQSDSTVLILGETGTGKELIARAIHNLSTAVTPPDGEDELRGNATLRITGKRPVWSQARRVYRG